jgi:magnesium-transporting ATPase (P-type)
MGPLPSANDAPIAPPPDRAGLAGRSCPGEASERGLTAAEAARRLRVDGPNVLPVTARTPAWRSLLHQMTHFFARMLWVAGVLAIVAGMPQLGIAIFAVVIVNGVFAWVQEHRADAAAERLRDLLPRRATVVREGVPLEIDAAELVVGDRVLLAAGDRISADLTAVRVDGLSVDTSMLTGESVPARIPEGGGLHAGTFVVEGEAAAVVGATGSGTRLAGLAHLTTDPERSATPLARELNRVVRTVSKLAVGVGVAFFGLALLIGTPATDGFLFAVGVTVALVPEGLLPTVTLSLAMGAQRMAHRHALVRRLEAVATLGSTTFICTDKTGTLTCNEMAVVRVWTPVGSATVTGSGYEPTGAIAMDGVRGDTRAELLMPALRRLATTAVRCSTGRAVLVDGGWHAQGDPMEAALDAFARRVDAPDGSGPLLRRFPFDARRRRMSAVAAGALHVKGAPDAVLPRCAAVDDATRAAVEHMAAQGLRVLAVATRALDATGSDDGDADADVWERNLELLGLVGLEDPPRPAVTDAIAACRRAGIRVAMVTGDHPATARAIAAEIGLLGPEALVVEGRDLPDDDEILAALVDRDGIVLARIEPEDKVRIAKALQRRGHVVAMTGDGVNDGPALHAADIGVAMGRSGTDVAREAADLVLLDDDFSTIVAAVEQGRATFANVRRFLTYHLTDNVAELTPFVVWALSGGKFPLALGVLQILCLDIGTDLMPALALGAEAAAPDTLQRPPWRQRVLDRAVLVRAFGVLGPTEALVEMTAFLVALATFGWRPGHGFPTGHPVAAASGAAFMAVVLGQMANAFACRSTTRRPGALGWRTNRLLLLAVLLELLLLLGFLGIGPVARTLDHAWPPLAGALVALLAVPAVFAADALHKWSRQRDRPVRPARDREVA